MRSPSNAPCENGELGSTETTPTLLPSARALRTSPEASVDLPTPGGPVRPMVMARPALVNNARTSSRPRPDSACEIARASARGLRASKSRSSSA